MRFHYTATTPKGKRVSGDLTADDKFDVARQLKRQDKVLIEARERDGNSWGERFRKLNMIFARVKTQDKILFAKNLSAMVAAGLSLSRSMSVLGKQTQNAKFKSIISRIENDIQEGNALSDSLKKFPKTFSNLFTAMVHAGEESGNLGDSLAVIGSQMEKGDRLRKKIRGAMIYPSIIIIVMIIVGILMLMFVVPTLTATFGELGVDLPATTQAVITVSEFLRHNTIIALGSLLLVIVAAVAFFRTPRGKRVLDFSLLHVPFMNSLVKKTNAARTARTLSSLLSSGVDIVQALSITKDVMQNSYYKEILEESEERVQKGVVLSVMLKEAEDFYPVLVGEMVEVGEETGKLADMLGEVATFYENEVEEATKNLSTVIEPVLMVIVGVAVGFFAISMITPMYSLLEGI